MNLLQGLFQRWIGSSFQPISHQFIGAKFPIVIDTGDLMKVYKDVPHLRIVIDKKAEMFSNMEIKLQDKKGNLITEHPVLNLLQKPNILQPTEKFMVQYSTMLNIYANAFIYKNIGLPGSLPGALWVLPSGSMRINATGKLFKQTTIEGIIENYEIVQTNERFSPSEIIQMTQGESEMYFSGTSKIYSLTLPLSNILASLKSRNILITERGAIGILSSASKDSDGAVPLGREERERIEKQYQADRSIDSRKGHVIVTNSALNWQPMTIPVRDLMLFEEIEDDFSAIIASYGMSRDIFPSTKGATFENQKQALKATYQDTIQPEADSLMNMLTTNLGLNKLGLKLIADYSWLPCMQEDQAQIQKIQTDKTNALHTQFTDGVITIEEYRAHLGLN